MGPLHSKGGGMSTIQTSISLKNGLKLFIDVQKADGRILRYHITEDPPCPRCNTRGCQSKYKNGKEDDWTRICQKCGVEFSLIEILPNKKS